VSKNVSLMTRGVSPSETIVKNSLLRERNFGVFEGSNVSSFLEEAKKNNMGMREFTPGKKFAFRITFLRLEATFDFSEGGETTLRVQERIESFYKVIGTPFL